MGIIEIALLLVKATLYISERVYWNNGSSDFGNFKLYRVDYAESHGSSRSISATQIPWIRSDPGI
jgi:hypothetical protein